MGKKQQNFLLKPGRTDPCTTTLLRFTTCPKLHSNPPSTEFHKTSTTEQNCIKPNNVSQQIEERTSSELLKLLFLYCKIPNSSRGHTVTGRSASCCPFMIGIVLRPYLPASCCHRGTSHHRSTSEV